MRKDLSPAWKVMIYPGSGKEDKMKIDTERLLNMHPPTSLQMLSIGALIKAVIFGLKMAVNLYRPQRKKSKKHPTQLGLPGRDLKIKTAGGKVTLSAWWIPYEGAQNTVIIGHELGSAKSSKLPYARFLYQAGYNVLLFDLRNHGQSSLDARLLCQSRRFTDDLEAVIRYVSHRPDVRGGGIAILAFSFSCFPAIQVLKRGLRVTAIITDSGPRINLPKMYADFLTAFKRFLVPRAFHGPVLFRAVIFSYTCLGYALLAVRWPPAISDVTTQMLLIGNADDPISPADEIKAFAALKPGTSCWISPGTSHLQAFRKHSDQYKQKVLDFLAREFARQRLG
jgi:pimeloyl-ACP methyl ester carboxylesterase